MVNFRAERETFQERTMLEQVGKLLNLVGFPDRDVLDFGELAVRIF